MDIQERADAIFRDVARKFDELEYERAKDNPRKHRLTRIMERGKPTNYRYYSAGKDGHGWSVWFCYCTNRNAAGYFLCWRERRAPKKSRSKVRMKRDKWTAEKLRKDAREWARRQSLTVRPA